MSDANNLELRARELRKLILNAATFSQLAALQQFVEELNEIEKGLIKEWANLEQ